MKNNNIDTPLTREQALDVAGTLREVADNLDKFTPEGVNVETYAKLVNRIDELEFIIVNHATHNGRLRPVSMHPHNSELLDNCGIDTDRIHEIQTQPEYFEKKYTDLLNKRNGSLMNDITISNTEE